VTIALVCPDGISILLFCRGIIRALQRIEGARVIVVSDAGAYEAEIEALGVTSRSVPIARWVNPIEDVKYVMRLARVFRRERCDVVLNFSTKANIYGTIAARLARVPTVLSHVVGLGGAFMPPRGVGDRIVRRGALILYRLACAWSDRVWFTNGNDLGFFVSHGVVSREKAVLTRNYLDVDAYGPGSVSAGEVDDVRRELGLAASDRVVLMVARMIWAKGIREFADAAELLRERHPNAKFLLVAPLEEGSRDAVPESFVRERERGGNFKWLGFRNDVKRLYALCDLAVLPSYYKEGGYPRALLEPMAMGRPIITTDSEDCRSTVDVDRNGYIVPVRDSKALAEAIARLIDDEDTRIRFGRHSRLKAQREFDEREIVAGALTALGLPVAV
jgi:N,N'-diacetylbacillosaminyl-diphospho-undecaprenol alpha-1,3-N-acetylgalactosaminyltransferase